MSDSSIIVVEFDEADIDGDMVKSVGSGVGSAVVGNGVGSMVGEAVGSAVAGLTVCSGVGSMVGKGVGSTVVGLGEGGCDGIDVTSFVVLGGFDNNRVGDPLGNTVGRDVGETLVCSINGDITDGELELVALSAVDIMLGRKDGRTVDKSL